MQYENSHFWAYALNSRKSFYFVVFCIFQGFKILPKRAALYQKVPMVSVLLVRNSIFSHSYISLLAFKFIDWIVSAIVPARSSLECPRHFCRFDSWSVIYRLDKTSFLIGLSSYFGCNIIAIQNWECWNYIFFPVLFYQISRGCTVMRDAIN